MFPLRIPIACFALCLLGAGLTSPSEAGSTELTRGKSLYMEVCKTCHGIDGTGAGTMRLNPPSTDLTSARVQEKLDAGLFKSIHDGRKNTAMGAWKHALSDEEIQDVIAYVRTLGGGKVSLPAP